MGLAFESAGTASESAGERDRAAFERALGCLSFAVEQAAKREAVWLGRVRAGMVALLAFFDDEPERGRLLVRGLCWEGGVGGLRREQRVLGVLRGLLDDGSPQVLGEVVSDSGLIAELVSGGVLAMIRSRMVGEDAGALVELAPALMAFIVRPYLGQAVAAVELSGRPAPEVEEGSSLLVVERRSVALPIRVTRRALLVLEAVSSAPRASNREIAGRAGIGDEGQTSRLLGRLQERGLIENVGAGAMAGGANAWLLTAQGRRTLQLIGPARSADVASRRARRLRGSA